MDPCPIIDYVVALVQAPPIYINHEMRSRLTVVLQHHKEREGIGVAFNDGSMVDVRKDAAVQGGTGCPLPHPL